MSDLDSLLECLQSGVVPPAPAECAPVPPASALDDSEGSSSPPLGREYSSVPPVPTESAPAPPSLDMDDDDLLGATASASSAATAAAATAAAATAAAAPVAAAPAVAPVAATAAAAPSAKTAAPANQELEEEETDEERNERLVALRGLNPDLTPYTITITFLDGCSAEFEVTEDFTIGEFTATIANSIGVLEAAPLFHICQGLRTSNAPISSVNYEKWLPRSATLRELGLVDGNIEEVLGEVPLIFRMRWYVTPSDDLMKDNIPLMHQLFLQTKRSLMAENLPMSPNVAIRLLALYLQASFGDFDPNVMKPGTLAGAPEGTYFSRSVHEAIGDVVKLESMAFTLYKSLRGTPSLDAENTFLSLSQSTWCPLTGATTFMIAGTTGIRRRTIVLPDGLAVELGSTLRFHPLKDIADINLTKDKKTVEITVLTPFTAAQRPGDAQPREVMRFTSEEAPNIAHLLAGYIGLQKKRLPAPPDTTASIGFLEDLPPPSMTDKFPLRENVFLEQSVAHAFIDKFKERCNELNVPPPQQILDMFRDVILTFSEEGFNEYKFCKHHHIESAAHLGDSELDDDDDPSAATSGPPLTTAFTGAASPAATERKQRIRLPFGSISEMDLTGIPMKKQHLQAFCDAIAFVAPYMDKTGVPQNFVMRRLILNRNSPNMMNDVISMLGVICSSPVPLTRLYVRRLNFSTREAGAVMAAVISMKTLEDFRIDHNPDLKDEGVFVTLMGLVADLPKLKTFSCVNCGLTGEGITKLESIIKRYKRPTVLRLCGNDLSSKKGPRKIASLLQLCTPLEDLDLEDCDLKSSGIMTIFQSLPDCTTLRKLRVARNGINDKCVNKLAEMVTEGTCYINTIDLSGNDIGKGAYVALLRSLTSPSARLTSVLLNDVPFPKTAVSVLAELANSHVVCLGFSNSKMPPKALTELAALLGTCPSIQTLDISRNAFPSDVLKTFGAAVCSSAKLIDLDMSDCSSKPDTLTDFFKEATGNTTLRRLSLSRNKMSGGALQALAGMINAPGSKIKSLGLCGLVTNLEALRDFFSHLNNKGALQTIDFRLLNSVHRLDIIEDYLRLTNVNCLFSSDSLTATKQTSK